MGPHVDSPDVAIFPVETDWHPSIRATFWLITTAIIAAFLAAIIMLLMINRVSQQAAASQKELVQLRKYVIDHEIDLQRIRERELQALGLHPEVDKQIAESPQATKSALVEHGKHYYDVVALKASGIGRGFNPRFHHGLAIFYPHIIINGVRMDYDSKKQAFVVANGQEHEGEIVTWETSINSDFDIICTLHFPGEEARKGPGLLLNFTQEI